MTSPSAPKDKFFEKVINPYLAEVLQHPQTIEMHEGVLHIRDVEGPRCTGSMETKLEDMEKEVFKCQGMVDRGLNANQMVEHDLQNQNCEYEYRFKQMSLAADLRIPETRSSFYD